MRENIRNNKSAGNIYPDNQRQSNCNKIQLFLPIGYWDMY